MSVEPAVVWARIAGVVAARTEPAPGDVRDTMRDIFERSEFARERSWWERFLDWLSRRLGDVGGDGATVAPGWGGALADIVVWVVLAVLVVALALLIRTVVRNRLPRRRRRRAEVVVEVTEQRSTAEWRASAEQHEAVGAWKEAIRCRYRELVARLVADGVADPRPGRTTGELRGDVNGTAPGAAPEFDRATELFEMPWYADAPTGPAENEEFRTLAERVVERSS